MHEGQMTVAVIGFENGSMLIGKMDQGAASSLKAANSAPAVVDLFNPAKLICEGVPAQGHVGGFTLANLTGCVALPVPVISIKRDAIKFYTLERGQSTDQYEKMLGQMGIGKNELN